MASGKRDSQTSTIGFLSLVLVPSFVVVLLLDSVGFYDPPHFEATHSLVLASLAVVVGVAGYRYHMRVAADPYIVRRGSHHSQGSAGLVVFGLVFMAGFGTVAYGNGFNESLDGLPTRDAMDHLGAAAVLGLRGLIGIIPVITFHLLFFAGPPKEKLTVAPELLDPDAPCPLCASPSVPLPGRPDSVYRRCPNCSNAYRVDRIVERARGPRSRNRVREIEEPPSGLSATRHSHSVEVGDPYRHEAFARDDISIKRRSPWGAGRVLQVLFTVVFTLVWNAFTWVMALGFVLADANPLWVYPFFLPFILVGFLFIGGTLAELLNVDIVEVEGDQLRAYTTPIRWGPIRSLSASDVDQLWVESRYHLDSEGFAGHTDYTLMVRDKAGERVELLDKLPTVDQALWIEQQVEDCLGIIDVAVQGEVRPPKK